MCVWKINKPWIPAEQVEFVGKPTPDEPNIYVYANANPINFVDPLGLAPLPGYENNWWNPGNFKFHGNWGGPGWTGGYEGSRTLSLHRCREAYYLLELSRYIVLNPVNAHMVESPEEWIWSSYRGTAGIVEPAPPLTVDWILSQFSLRRRTAQEMYKEFVRQGYECSSPWEHLEGDLFLGEPGFAQSVRQKLEEQTTSIAVSKRQRSAGRLTLAELLPDELKSNNPVHNRTIIEAFEHHLYTQTEIGEQLKLHPASISRIIKDWKGKY